MLKETHSKILLITMGGTINAEAYSEKDGEYPVYSTMPNSNIVLDAVKTICSQRNNIELSHVNICNKDSKNLNAQDQDNLLKDISNTSDGAFNRIIVTIGTDCMCEFARNVQTQNIDSKCPIIFTGAIWPLANGNKSDGWINLENALFSCPDISHDVYIAMGNVFAPANHVKKDFENKVFIDTNSLTNRGA